MKGKAILKLNKPQKDNPQSLFEESYDLIFCEYTFTKEVDRNGSVQNDKITGNIVVAIPILPNDKIMSWVLDISKKYNGEITFNNDFSESFEKIYFEEGRPIAFRLHYEPSNTMCAVLILTINAQRLILGQSEYQNKN